MASPINGALSLYKEARPLGYMPIYLCTFAFVTGQRLNVCSRQGDAQGQIGYLLVNGTQYQNRVVAQNLQSTQAMQSIGLDTFPGATVGLANGDSLMWEYEMLYGFQGARLSITLVLYDLRSGTATNDPRFSFTGICDPAQMSMRDVPQNGEIDPTVFISAKSDWNFDKKLMPRLPDQRRCWRTFPTTLAQRQAIINTLFPILSEWCSYSPDIPNGAGNLQSNGTPFPSCDFSKANCIERGMYKQDNHGKGTGLFGGNTYNTPALWRSKSYEAGKTILGTNNANLAQFNQHYPEVYGATWVNTPIILTTAGDGNATRWEVAVCAGLMDNMNGDIYNTNVGISKVEVNGILVPRAGTPGSDQLFSWSVISPGWPTGLFNGFPGFTDSNHQPLGDPHGGICKIEIIVFNDLADSTSLPTIRVLVGDAGSAQGYNGKILLEPTDLNGNFTMVRTDNPASVILELMRRNGIDIFKQVDLPSYFTYRAFASTLVTYKAVTGQIGQHRRYGVSLTLDATQQYQVGNLIQQLRLANNLMIFPSNTGKIKFQAKAGLADTHPNPVEGSNNNVGIHSWKATDSALSALPTGIGYAAYWFDNSNIIRASVKITQNTVAQSANLIKCQISDEEYDHIQDSVTFGDPTAAARVGQNINSVINLIGLPNVDQASRVTASYMAELFRGNIRDDSGGTIMVEFDTTVLAAHLDIGNIVVWQDDFTGFKNIGVNNTVTDGTGNFLPVQLFRVISIAPTMDYERVHLKLQFHDDRWYTDDYNVINPYALVDAGDGFGPRNPMPWRPNAASSIADDALFAGVAGAVKTFNISRGVDVDANTGNVQPAIVIWGESPVNTAATIAPPLLQRYANLTGTSGGAIPNGTVLYFYVSSIDANGLEGPLSRFPSTVFLTSSTNTNIISFGAYNWPDGAIGCRIYAGTRQDQIALFASLSGTPSFFVVGTLPSPYGSGPVDIHAKSLVVYVKRLVIGGIAVMGPLVDTRTGSITQNVIGTNYIQFQTGTDVIFSNLPLGVAVDHAYDGYLMACVGRIEADDGGVDTNSITDLPIIPFFTCRIAQNLGNTFYISGISDLEQQFKQGFNGISELADSYFVVYPQLTGYAANADGSATLTFAGAISPANHGAGTLTTGTYARIIEGPGKGTAPRLITAGEFSFNIPSNIHHIAQAFDVAPVPGQSVLIFEEPTWRYESSTSITCSKHGQNVEIGADLPNVQTSLYYCEVDTQDTDGTEPVHPYANPYRLFWWDGDFTPNDLGSIGLNLLSNPGFEIGARRADDTAAANWFSDVNSITTDLTATTVVPLTGAPYAVTRDTNSYQGSFDLHAKLQGGQTIPAGGLADLHIQHRHSFSCSPGDTFYVQVAVAKFIPDPSVLPASDPSDPGPVLATSIFLFVDYTDGTSDPYFANTQKPSEKPDWTIFYQKVKIRTDKTPKQVRAELYVSLRNFRNTPYLIPFDALDVWFDNAEVVEAVNFDSHVVGTSLTAITGQGSIIPTQTLGTTIVQNAFDGVNATITIQWNTQTLQRSDKTFFTVNSGVLNWTGLSGGTTYHVYLYGVPTDETYGTYNVKVASGDPPIPPPSGPDQNSAITSYYDGHQPLANLTIATPSSPGSGGSGGGNAICPDGTRCKVYHRDKGPILAVDVQVGDWLRGRDLKTGDAVYRKVVARHWHSSSTWYVVNGCPVSPCHEVRQDDKWVHPYRIGKLDTKRGKRIQLTLDAPDFDSHNFDLVDDDGEMLLVMHNLLVGC